MNPQNFTSVQTFHTHNSLTHNSLSHKSLTHKSLTHNSLTHNSLTHKLSLTHTQLSHTQLSHTHNSLTHTQLSHTHKLSHTQLSHTTCALCGKCGTYGIGLGRLVVAVVAAAVCVASVVLGGIGLHFAWQAWRLATSACTLCGKRGTYGNGLALVVPVCRRGRRGYWCGRRGLVTSTFTLGGSRHRPALCVAGVALPVCRRGRRGCCVAGVALGDIDLHFVWQAWRLATFDLHFAWQAWHLATLSCTAGVVLLGEGVRRCV